MRIKLFLILCTLIIVTTTLSGCYDARGIEDMLYATALGLDFSEENLLSLTLQFSVPSSSSESGSSQSSKTNITTVECSSINSGISLINSYISKEVNLSHCKVIVISEKLAAQGLSQYLDTLENNLEIRPDCNVIITRCTAKNFIENSSPSIETLAARYYEVALKSSEYTGYTTSTTLNDFIGNVKSSFIQAHGILGGINNGNNKAVSDGNYAGIDSQYKADETPIKNSSNVETFGTAVFYDDKLVGELNGMETICYLIVTNKLKTCMISIPDPFNINSSVDIRIDKKRKADINVEYVNDTPYISINVYLNGHGLSLDQDTDYASLKDINILNSYAEQYMKVQLENYLYKTSKELNSDISGFGKFVMSKYLTWDDWIESNWLANYKNAFFKVNVDVNIESGSEFNKSP